MAAKPEAIGALSAHLAGVMLVVNNAASALWEAEWRPSRSNREEGRRRRRWADRRSPKRLR